jgi:hypothetical protein
MVLAKFAFRAARFRAFSTPAPTNIINSAVNTALGTFQAIEVVA